MNRLTSLSTVFVCGRGGQKGEFQLPWYVTGVDICSTKFKAGNSLSTFFLNALLVKLNETALDG